MLSKLLVYFCTLSSIAACLTLTYFMVWRVPSKALTTKTELQSSLDIFESTPQTKEARNVIFDLHGVLFTINQKKAIDHLGMFDILSYTIGGNKVEDLEDVIFDILYRIKEHPLVSAEPNQLVPMHNGRVLPPIMCAWLRGTITSKTVIQQITTLIEELYTENYFKSRAQKKLVLKIITIMFDPSIRTILYKPLKKGVAIMRECKEQGHRIYLMSNMDSELIPLLSQKYPEIFELFDGILVSADVGMIKPDAIIYTHLLQKFGLDPSTCYFIDDQKENILGAKKVGIKAIQHNQRKTKKTRKKLGKWGILPLTTNTPSH